MNVNEAMVTGKYGLMLLVAREGKPRLKARLCEGGRYELSYGCTTWPAAPGETEGRAIGAADVCTEDQALQLFAYHIRRFELIVEKYITVPLNQFQYDAHVCLAYNIGEGQYRSSSVVMLTNERRWSDAAEAFGLYVFATSSRPSDKQRNVKSLQEIIGDDGRWKAPDGTPCEYRQAFAGLLSRHYSEGLMSEGLPWEDACGDGQVFLHSVREWDAKQHRWEDAVTDSTPYAKVKAKAETYPRLAPAEPPAPAAKVTTPVETNTKPVEGQKPPVAILPPAAPAKPAAAPPMPRPLPPPPAPYIPEYQVPKGAVTPGVPPQAKPQEASRRFWGAFLFYGGKLIMLLGVSTLPGKFAVAFGETWGAVVKDPQLFGMAIDALCFSTGFVADHCGAWIRQWGNRHAKGPMVTGGERPQVTAIGGPS